MAGLHHRLQNQLHPEPCQMGCSTAGSGSKSLNPGDWSTSGEAEPQKRGSGQLLGTFSQPCPRVGLAGVADARRARTAGGNRGRGGRSVGDGRQAGGSSRRRRQPSASSRAALGISLLARGAGLNQRRHAAAPRRSSRQPAGRSSSQAEAAAAEQQLAGRRSSGRRRAARRQRQLQP